MRKCDICDTRIPFGEDRCPNCGFPYKPERKLSEEVREAKKEKYMSQFEPHPSPLDSLKKGEIPDFSKIYDGVKGAFNKQASRTIRPTRRKGNPFLIIPILIAFFVASTFIFGISYGITNIFEEFNSDFDIDFSDFEDEDFYDDDYAWFESGAQLKDAYYDVYVEVEPYYNKMANYVSNTDDIMEMYGVEYGQLYYANIGTNLLLNDHYIYSVFYYEDDEWFELYQGSKDIGYDKPLSVNQGIVNALAYLTQVDVSTIEGFMEDFINQYKEGFTYKYIYSDDGGTFYFTFDDGVFYYEYENFISITE